jgi:hypothetical protein
MLAALETEGKIVALGLAMVLSIAGTQTSMKYLLPIRFRLRTVFFITAFLAVIFALLGFAFS